MSETKVYKGITFTRVLRAGCANRYKWVGGEVGGVFFEEEVTNGFQYGFAGLWNESFEAAADISIASRRSRYVEAKAYVDAFEKEERAIGDKVMWEPVGGGSGLDV